LQKRSRKWGTITEYMDKPKGKRSKKHATVGPGRRNYRAVMRGKGSKGDLLIGEQGEGGHTADR